MEYVVYLASNGEIVRTICCPAGSEGEQLGEGEACVPGSGVSWLTHRVVDGELVALDVPRSPPAAGAAWDPVQAAWYDPLTREETADRARAQRRTELLQAIAALEVSQARPLRELALAQAKGEPVPAAELQRVIGIDEQIVQARLALAALS